MTNELAKLQANLPAYLKVENDHSLDEVKQHVRPPRIKVIQGTSDDELKSTFGLGSVILVPDNIQIMSVTEYDKGIPNPASAIPFKFTPIFFFTEYCIWNPIQMKGKLPAIRERSFDKNSKVAARCRDFSNRVFACPESPQYNCVACEHLNFIIQLDGTRDQCILTFSRGEYKAGERFITMCKVRAVPLYGNIFEAHLAHRKNDKGNWYGLDIANPENDPFVGEELFNVYKALHLEYAELYKQQQIEVNYEDDVIEVEAVSTAAETM